MPASQASGNGAKQGTSAKKKGGAASFRTAEDEKMLDDAQSVVRIPWYDGTIKEVNALTFRALAGLSASGVLLVFALFYHFYRSGSSDFRGQPGLGGMGGGTGSTNPDLRSFLSDIPPLGYFFALSTAAGAVMMFYRVKTRRDGRKQARYNNGLKVAGIVCSWIAFMMFRTFSHFFNSGSAEDALAEAGGGAGDLLKTVVAGSTAVGLGYLTYLNFCKQRPRSRKRRRHSRTRK